LHRVQGAVAVYLLFGLIWAFAYDFVILHAPQAFHADELTVQHGPLTPTLIYFSFTTLTTVGYGDITPIHPIARSLAMLEAFVGQLFPAILIARLVRWRAAVSADEMMPGFPGSSLQWLANVAFFSRVTTLGLFERGTQQLLFAFQCRLEALSFHKWLDEC
jgi:Ion channel.